MRFQEIQIPLASGVDTKSDPKVVTGKLLTLENAEFSRPGSIVKRNGYAELSDQDALFNMSGKEIVGWQHIASCSDLLYGIVDVEDSVNGVGMDDGGLGVVWSAELGKWVPLRTIQSATPSIRQVSQVGAYCPDYCYCNGYHVFGFEDGTPRVTILDELGTVILDAVEVHSVITGTNLNVRVFAHGTDVYVSYTGGLGSGDWYMRKIDTTDLTLPSAPVFGLSGTMLTTSSFYDITKSYWEGGSAQDCFVISYENSSGILEISWLAFTGTPSVLSTVSTGIAIDSSNGIDDCYDHYSGSSYIVVGYHDASSSTVDYRIYNRDGTYASKTGTLLSSATPTLLRQISFTSLPAYDVSTPSNSSFIAVTTHYSGSEIQITAQPVKFSTGSVASDRYDWRHCSSLAKPFVHDGVLYLLISVFSPDGLQSATALVRIGDSFGTKYSTGSGMAQNIVCLAQRNWQKPVREYVNSIGRPKQDSDGNWHLATTCINPGGDGTHITDCKFEFGLYPSSANYEQETFVAVGLLLQSSDALSPVGFPHYPYIISLSQSATGGYMDDGTYGIQVVYEYTDREGQLHVSAPSILSSIVVSGGGSSQKISVTVANLTLGSAEMLSKAKIVVYRTLDGGTQTLYKAAESDNDASAHSQVIDLVGDDDDVSVNQILYTSGYPGPLANMPPPPGNIVHAHNNRLFMVAADDPSTIWYSKEKAKGYGFEFADEQTIRVSRDAEITGLSSLSSSVIVFTKTSIFSIDGDGPDNLGYGSFTSPREIYTGIGCIDKNSIVRFGGGICFRSVDGIYLINSSGQVSNIGHPIESYLDRDIVSAVLVQAKNQIRYGMNGVGSPVLVFDYLMQQWSVFTNMAHTHACSHDSVYTFAASDLSVYRESGYTDDGAAISLKATTEWIKLGGIQGFQRLRKLQLLGDWYNGHTVAIKLYYDYDETVAQTVTYAATTDPGSHEIEIHPARARCKAFKVEIYDTGSTTGQGCSWTGIQAKIGILPGLNRVVTGRKAG